MSRYIDADAVKGAFQDKYVIYDDTLEIIDSVPTADVRKIERMGDILRVEYEEQDKIGRVLLTNGVWCSEFYLDRADGENICDVGFLCSVCSFGDFDGFHGYRPKYCPNCGAKMRGES